MVEIEWSSIVQNDLNKIIDYIAQDSLEYALLFYEQVREKVENSIISTLSFIIFFYLIDISMNREFL